MDRPNILVIMTDQQKATASHLYGNPNCETPNLAALAQQGVRYEHTHIPMTYKVSNALKKAHLVCAVLVLLHFEERS